MTGIVLCLVALALTVVGAILYLSQVGLRAAARDWGLWVIISVLLVEVALLWGNIAIVYSHAGFTG
jgi:hypothetical protein